MLETMYWGQWVMSHWRELGELLMLLVIVVQAIRGHRWATLLTLAAQLAYKAGDLADLEDPAKRKAAAAELYKVVSSPLFKKLVTEKQCEEIINWLWDKLAAEAKKPIEGGK